MPEWILPVGVPLLTGLTYIAYRHPDAFKTIMVLVTVLVFFWFFSALVWWQASYQTYLALWDLIPPDKFAASRAIAEPIASRPWVLFPYCMVAYVYLYLLTYLPKLIGEQEQVKVERDLKDDEKIQ